MRCDDVRRIGKPPKPSGQRLWGNGTASEHVVEPWMDKIKDPEANEIKREREKNILLLFKRADLSGAYGNYRHAVQKTLDPIEIAVVRAEIAHGYFILKDKLR